MFRRHAAAFLFRQHAAFGDAEQRVMRRMHRGLGEIDIIGGDDRQAMGIGQTQQRGLDHAFHRQAMAVQFHHHIVGAEDLLQLRQQPRGRIPPPIRQQPPERAGGASGQQDQPLAVAPQRIQRHAGLAGGIVAEIA